VCESLFFFFGVEILSALGQNGTLPAFVKCVNLLFWAAILFALGEMALLPNICEVKLGIVASFGGENF
jgi:hypothetical protein